MKVLVVDDSELAIAVAQNALTKAGYEVHTAMNGLEALEFLRQGSCRLVVTDLSMPQMNGLELCQAVRKEKLSTYIYIILLTAHDGPQQRIDALTAGADDFLSKPFDPAELVASVRNGERMLTAELADLQSELGRRRHAEETLKARTQQQAIVAQLGQRALAGVEISVLMEEAVAHVARILDVENSHILELLPDGKALLMRAGVGWKQGLVGTARADVGPKTFAECVLTTGLPVSFEDLRMETRFAEMPLFQEHGLVSGIAVPIQGRERPFGLLAAYSTKRRDFAPHDLHFLHAVANVLATMIDRQRSIAALTESEQRFRQIAENIKEVFWISSADGNQIIYVSPSYDEIWGRSSKELFQNPHAWIKSIHPEDRERVRAGFLGRGRTDGFDAEYRVVRPDGTIRWIWDRGFPIRNAGGEVYRIAGIAEDISERKMLDEQQQKSQQELTDFLENATEGLHWMDDQGVVLWANRAELIMLGYSREEYIGHRIAEFFADPKPAVEMLRRLSIHDELKEYETVLRHKNGSLRHVVINANALWQDGKFVYTRCFTRDITERKWAEEAIVAHQRELERANNDLARSNEKLSELYQTAQRFVDNVSHEFRTPLTVIKGYAEALSEEIAGPINEQQREFLAFVADRTRDLAQMVDDLLDSSKLRAGTLRVDRVSCTIEDLLAPVRPMLRAKASSNKVELVEEITADPIKIFADVEKAGRVIVNLVVNAIKYSAEGTQVKLWVHPEERGGIEVGVTDHGPGIAPENLDLIFERFKQVGNAQNITTKGFGLGLSIARELVALNLGEMNVKSTPGNGSTFSFTLSPDDAPAILERYFNYLSLLKNADQSVAAIRVAFGSSEMHGDICRKFIASAIRATDLILQESENRSLLIVGCAAHPEQWADQLLETTKSFNTQRGDSKALDEVSIEQVASWPYPAAKAEAISGILEAMKGELAHA